MSEKTRSCFQALTENQCKRVVDASYRILETTGVQVASPEVRDLLASRGCTVEGEIVRVPATLMKWSVDAAPSRVQLYSREGEPALILEPGGKVYFGTTISTTETYDLETGELRMTGRQDAENFAVVADALPNTDWMAAGVAVTDVPQAVADIAEVQVLSKVTAKPFMYWALSPENLQVEFDMFAAIAGSEEAFIQKPFAFNLICPQDPLIQPGHALDQVVFMAQKGAPFAYVSSAAFGLTSPMSVASGLALSLANTLVGNLVAQLTREGTPYIAGKFMDNLDIATGKVRHGAPEFIIGNMATGDIMRYLGLPFIVNYGGSDTYACDMIAATDASLQAYCAQISGANLVFGPGSLGTGMVMSLEKLLFGDEMVQYVRAMDGFGIDDEDFYFDEIQEEGHGAAFLTADSTMDNMRDFYYPTLIKSRKKNQQETLLSELTSKVKEIIAAGTKHPLDADKAAAVDAIMQRAAEASA